MNKNVLSKYWGAILFRGILAILFGLVALFWTGITIEVLVILFALYALIGGVVSIIGSFMAMKDHSNWWMYLLQGIAGVVIGIMVFTWPAITVLILLYFVAIWAIISGIIEIIVSFSEKEEVIGKWVLGTTGIISLIIGFTLFFFPVVSIELLIWIIGVYALIFGVSLSILSFQIKKG